jgi:hypothetical protein
MRDDAARALRVDDEVAGHSAGLHAVATVDRDDDFEAQSRARRSERGPSPEATMALRHFERLVEASGAGYDSPPAGHEERPAPRHEERPRAERRFDRSPPAAARPAAPVVEGALALEEPVPEPPRAPRSAPGRAYGSHRRADGLVTPRSGYQPGRRTVEITGQPQPPRRRPSSTTAALVARPDRVALWAFMLAMFLVVMAIATAHP